MVLIPIPTHDTLKMETEKTKTWDCTEYERFRGAQKHVQVMVKNMHDNTECVDN